MPPSGGLGRARARWRQRRRRRVEAGERIRDFILEEKIGAGGAGEVWLARHQYLHNTVAIKAIHRHASQDPHFRERFLEEASVHGPAGASAHRGRCASSFSWMKCLIWS